MQTLLAPCQDLSDLLPVTQHMVTLRNLDHDYASTAQVIAKNHGLSVDDVLRTRYGIHPRTLVQAQSDTLNAQLIGPVKHPGDPRLMAQFGPQRGLQVWGLSSSFAQTPIDFRSTAVRSKIFLARCAWH